MAGLIKRGKYCHATYCVAGHEKRVSLRTDSLQVAKEKLRQLESGLAQGDDDPFPTRTPTADVVEAYVRHTRTVKTPQSAQVDIYYLRDVFGASRYKTDSKVWTHRLMPPIVSTQNGHHIVMGQRKWKVPGGFPHVDHGGLTLLEVAVPFLEFPPL